MVVVAIPLAGTDAGRADDDDSTSKRASSPFTSSLNSSAYGIEDEIIRLLLLLIGSDETSVTSLISPDWLIRILRSLSVVSVKSEIQDGGRVAGLYPCSSISVSSVASDGGLVT